MKLSGSFPIKQSNQIQIVYKKNTSGEQNMYFRTLKHFYYYITYENIETYTLWLYATFIQGHM